MALEEPLKKGGRYTKKEQEERRIQVYHLHFEENKSAVKIAELLNVNRNTINEDISFWHSQLCVELKTHDLADKMTKQIQRKEIQRERILETLEEAENVDEKIKLEKSISEIDNSLTNLFSNMISNGIKNLKPTVKLETVNENEIREFVRDIILADEDPDATDLYSETNLKFDFIKRTKCDVDYANNVIEKMKKDGLSLCLQSDKKGSDFLSMYTYDESKYNLSKFATLRGYLTIEEFGSIFKKRIEIKKEIVRQEEVRENKFIKKYGADESQWPEGVADKFYETDEDP